MKVSDEVVFLKKLSMFSIRDFLKVHFQDRPSPFRVLLALMVTLHPMTHGMTAALS